MRLARRRAVPAEREVVADGSRAARPSDGPLVVCWCSAARTESGADSQPKAPPMYAINTNIDYEPPYNLGRVAAILKRCHAPLCAGVMAYFTTAPIPSPSARTCMPSASASTMSPSHGAPAFELYELIEGALADLMDDSAFLEAGTAEEALVTFLDKVESHIMDMESLVRMQAGCLACAQEMWPEQAGEFASLQRELELA